MIPKKKLSKKTSREIANWPNKFPKNAEASKEVKEISTGITAFTKTFPKKVTKNLQEKRKTFPRHHLTIQNPAHHRLLDKEVFPERKLNEIHQRNSQAIYKEI